MSTTDDSHKNNNQNLQQQRVICKDPVAQAIVDALPKWQYYASLQGIRYRRQKEMAEKVFRGALEELKAGWREKNIWPK
jgi:hypothetical protein